MNIVCYSGGKDSTAMLIYLIENNKTIDDILYVDMQNWMWKSSKKHIRQVEETLDVNITILNPKDEIMKGFARWGFPSMFNRWCTSIKRQLMQDYLQRERESNDRIIQYIGYTVEETKRTNKKLYSAYETEYPLVSANINGEQALQMCYDYGFDFGGVYEHHSHYNCWLCPLQKVKELEWIYNNDKEKWDYLRTLQTNTDGYYANGKTIYQLEHQFWENNREMLREMKLKARQKYNKNVNLND